MKTRTEVKLLMYRQNLKEAMDKVLAQDVVDMEVYRQLKAKMMACQYFLIQIRSKAVRIKKSAL